MVNRSLLNVALLGFVGCLAACGGGSSRSGFDNTPDGKTPADPDQGTSPTNPTGSLGSQNPATPAGDDSNLIHEVYGHSATTLYKLDPTTKAVTVVGNFDPPDSIVDIALDAKANIFGASNETLYTIDKTNAKLTKIASGNYPNSLSFVPQGTVDANAEALVGYNGGDYVRIDVQSGSLSTIGQLGGNLESSGDIVSVKGGQTYLTVKGGTSCTKNDCLVEVDPTTGKMTKNWGSIAHQNVFGLSFWGGKVYGFDDQGNLFEVTFGASTVTTSAIAIPQKPDGLSFWGAGSSTSAPLVSTPE